MLNFTEHMKRISYLADQALIHNQEEKFPVIREDIIRISIHCNEALQQLDQMTAAIQGDAGSGIQSDSRQCDLE